jgi:hypothetical protein
MRHNNGILINVLVSCCCLHIGPVLLDAYALNTPNHHPVNLKAMSCLNGFSVFQVSIGERLLDDANYLQTLRDIMNSQDHLRTQTDITNSQDEISQKLESKEQSIEKLLKACTAGSPNHPEAPAPQNYNGNSVNPLVGGTADEQRKVRAKFMFFVI